MRKVAYLLSLAIFFTVLEARGAELQGFSADIISTGDGEVMSGKMYAGRDKVRIDMGVATTIARMDKHVSWVLMKNQNMYIEQPMDPQIAANVTNDIPGEVEREFLGDTEIDGRPAKKYRIVYEVEGKRVEIFQWLDNAAGIPLRIESEGGRLITEYKNLSMGPQADSLFEVPPGYQKFIMPNISDMASGMNEGAE